MRYILPVPITETVLLASSAAAVTVSSVTEISVPPWVSLAGYKKTDRVLYVGVVYEAIKKHRKRGVAPDLDPRFWKVTAAATTNGSWVSAATYALAAMISRDTTHRIYECILAHTGRTTLPENDTAYWLDIGPTNRWAMFDNSTGTRTAAASPLTFTLQPGFIDSVAYLDVVGADSILTVMKDGATTVYTNTTSMADTVVLLDWYDYYFADIVPRTDLVLNDLPAYLTATLEVTVTGVANVSVGVTAVGTQVPLGGSHYGVNIGIVDYSVKEADAYGNMSVVERKFSRKIDVNLWIDNDKLDYTVTKLASIRATPCVWFEENVAYQSLVLYGFYKDWTATIAYPTVTEVSLSLEGIS